MCRYCAQCCGPIVIEIQVTEVLFEVFATTLTVLLMNCIYMQCSVDDLQSGVPDVQHTTQLASISSTVDVHSTTNDRHVQVCR